MHGDDDPIVPMADSALLSAKLVKNAALKSTRHSAWHVHDNSRCDQCELARILQEGVDPHLDGSFNPG
jgi:hypothetical protein